MRFPALVSGRIGVELTRRLKQEPIEGQVRWRDDPVRDPRTPPHNAEPGFGQVVMEMDGHTVAPGGTFTGIVRVPLNLKPLDDYELRLRCVENQLRATQRGTRLKDVIRWEETQRVNSRSVTPAEGVVFAFTIPADALAVRDPTGSLDMNTEGTVRWILEVKAPLKGLNFYAIYGVDVRAR